MVGPTPGEQLRLRKQALILESELNRLSLATEWRRVQAAAAWVGEAKRLGQRARTWWPVLAPLLGMLIARRLRRTNPGVDRAGSLLNALAAGCSLWNQFSSRRSRDGSTSSRED